MKKNPEWKIAAIIIVIIIAIIGVFLYANPGGVTGLAASQGASSITDEIEMKLSGGGFYDRRGYFLLSSNALLMNASGTAPIKIVVDKSVIKECSSSPCEHAQDFGRGIHLYYAESPKGRTPLRFFQIGQDTRQNTPECTDDNLDFSRDAFVEYNDIHKIFDVVSGGSCTVASCDVNKDGKTDEADAYALTEIVNSCFG